MSNTQPQSTDPEQFPQRLPGNDGFAVVLYEGDYLFYSGEHLVHRCNLEEMANLFMMMRVYLEHLRHPVLNRPFPAMPPSEATDAPEA